MNRTVAMKARVELRAPAKINLSLRVLGKYADGYHKIETLFLAVGLYDRVEIRRREDQNIRLQLEGSDLPGDESNLCYQAAHLFARHSRQFSGCSVRLWKRIPAGAGLGGGSSDAAATLLGLNQLFETRLPVIRLHQLAFQLGADVPFFLRPGVAIGRGKGQRLYYLDMNWDFWVVLVCPTYGISTRWAYNNLKIGLTNEKKNIILKSQNLRGIQLDVFYKFFTNNFEPLIYSRYPQLGEMKQRLYQQGAVFASLSGTGSTVFGIFRERKAAEKTATEFKNQVQTFIVKPLNTHSKPVVGVCY